MENILQLTPNVGTKIWDAKFKTHGLQTQRHRKAAGEFSTITLSDIADTAAVSGIGLGAMRTAFDTVWSKLNEANRVSYSKGALGEKSPCTRQSDSDGVIAMIELDSCKVGLNGK